MRFQEIQKVGKGMGINTYGMKKVEIIHAIQRTENTFVCYATDRVSHCGEEKCLWRNDCLAVNNNGKSN
jgi:7-cyano-7-deazaguanine synthase in queuosine biosynthesis